MRIQFKAKDPDFHVELIPVHSPLLRESYLVSFPPLTYMLKFSGFADLTSCLGREAAPAAQGSGQHTRRDTTPKSKTVKSLFKLLVARNTPCTACVKGESTRSGCEIHELSGTPTNTNPTTPQVRTLTHKHTHQAGTYRKDKGLSLGNEKE